MLCLHLQGWRVKQLAAYDSCLMVTCSSYSSALKIEAVHYSEMLVNLYQTTQQHTPADSPPHRPCSMNLISCKYDMLGAGTKIRMKWTKWDEYLLIKVHDTNWSDWIPWKYYFVCQLSVFLYFLYAWEVEAQADAKSVYILTAYGKWNLIWEQ
jgi:hypothetical protein